MLVAQKQLRARALDHLQALEEKGKLKEEIAAFRKDMDDSEATLEATAKLVGSLENCNDEDAKAALELKDYLSKRSFWIVGGDGYAYDIGYGGLDHVLSADEDINILILDTEVYSNTGGQASKATPVGAVAQFAAGGKRTKKKDLGAMAMTYGYVYVAQIAMGANQAQTLKALREAEAYKGPSLVIAYAPCINHGIRGGMTVSQTREKDAVETGYWHLYRYNPDLKKEGKNPFTLDSKAPTRPYTDFLKQEVRYTSLAKKFSEEEVNAIFEHAHEAADERYESYLRMARYGGPLEEEK